MKAIPVDQYPEESWWVLGGQTGMPDGALSPHLAYSKVGLLYRAVDIRAKAVSAFPLTIERNGRDVTKDDETLAFRHDLRRALWLTEASLCLYGASYALALHNGLKWLQPQTITPNYDPNAADGIAGWTRRVNGKEIRIKPKDITYTWLPNLAEEIGPGIAPAVPALAAAGVLHNLDRYLAGYFERGAIRATLLIVEGQPSKDEKEKLEKWWKRMLSGVKKAYETVALRSNVKPVVIGDGLQETTNKELTDQQREGILIPMGVPISIVLSNASTFATAQQDSLNFYDLTVCPQIELIAESFEPWFQKTGYRVIFHPERLDVYVDRLLRKADALSKISGPQPLLDRDESRRMLNLPPWADVAPPEPPARAALPDPPRNSNAPQGEAIDQTNTPSNPQPTNTSPSAKQPPAPSKAYDLDLARWEKKAAKRIAAGRSPGPFQSDSIPVGLQAEIRSLLDQAEGAADVGAIFRAIHRGPGQDLSATEQWLYDALVALFARFESAIVDQIISGGAVDLAQLDSAMRDKMTEAMINVIIDKLIALPATLDLPAVDPVQLRFEPMALWADQYIDPVIGGIQQTNRQLVESAVQLYRATPGMTRAHVEAMIAARFGAARADMIAVTEITRAQSLATRYYQEYLRRAGITMVRVWRTNRDDLVCAVCGPLNGKPESAWADRYPNGAPAHAGCRCSQTLQLESE
jgi:hypothetical protein